MSDKIKELRFKMRKAIMESPRQPNSPQSPRLPSPVATAGQSTKEPQGTSNGKILYHPNQPSYFFANSPQT